MNNLDYINIYIKLIPYLMISAILVFSITPFIGKLANWRKIIDLPANLRILGDRSTTQRLHKTAKLKLGGLGLIIIFILMFMSLGIIDKQIFGILVGVGILTIVGFLDDKYELSPKYQLLGQIVAAIVVVMTGTTIQEIDILDLNVNLVSSTIPIKIFNLVFIFSFPSSIVTVIWIVTIINAFNWMCGIDALGESIAVIISIAIGIISIETTNHPEIAIIMFILAGSILGFIPYNFPPSKILGGSISDFNLGFLLATMSILSEAKLSTSVVLLIIPIFDMLYVLIKRMIKHRILNPIRLLGISGNIHLHHRIINYGLTKKATLYVEIFLFSTITLIALLLEEVGKRYSEQYYYIYLIIITILVTTLLSILFWYKKNRSIKEKKKKILPKRAEIIKDIPPEERYKY